MRRLPEVYFLTVRIDFVATVSSMPFCQRCRTVSMLDNFSPTAAVISAKTDFTLSRCHGRSGVADTREIVIEGVLEPHTVYDHDSPASVIRIGFLRPTIAATGKAVETVLKQGAKFPEAKARGCLLPVEITKYGKRDKRLSCRW